jgi:predicted ATPase
MEASQLSDPPQSRTGPTPTSWYVLSGPQGSGKTTLANVLSAYGYHTLVESARLIAETSRIARRILTVEQDSFQQKVIELNIQRERVLDPGRVVFMDRAVPDTIAYCRIYGFDESRALQHAKSATRYKGVFLLDLGPYEMDAVRTESEAFARDLACKLEEVYPELGYAPIHVPWLPPRERAEFVLQHLGPDRRDEGTVPQALF